MLIGILSDTHDQLDRTRRAVELLRSQGAEALFHCGDLNSPDILVACSGLPLYFTLGNNDQVLELKQTAAELSIHSLGWGGIVELGGCCIGAVHGHQPSQTNRLLAESPDYLLSGHSHVASDSREGTVRRINPGALHRAKNYTVALLDLDSDTLRFLSVAR